MFRPFFNPENGLSFFFCTQRVSFVIRCSLWVNKIKISLRVLVPSKKVIMHIYKLVVCKYIINNWYIEMYSLTVLVLWVSFWHLLYTSWIVILYFENLIHTVVNKMIIELSHKNHVLCIVGYWTKVIISITNCYETVPRKKTISYAFINLVGNI